MSYRHKADPDKISKKSVRKYRHDSHVKHLEWARFQLCQEIERCEAANKAAPVKVYPMHQNEY